MGVRSCGFSREEGGPCTNSCVPLSRYYADIRQTISASDQEMNSALAELSRVNKNISEVTWPLTCASRRELLMQRFKLSVQFCSDTLTVPSGCPAPQGG